MGSSHIVNYQREKEKERTTNNLISYETLQDIKRKKNENLIFLIFFFPHIKYLIGMAK
jgi:hypothetical protein